MIFNWRKLPAFARIVFLCFIVVLIKHNFEQDNVYIMTIYYIFLAFLTKRMIQKKQLSNGHVQVSQCFFNKLPALQINICMKYKSNPHCFMEFTGSIIQAFFYLAYFKSLKFLLFSFDVSNAQCNLLADGLKLFNFLRGCNLVVSRSLIPRNTKGDLSPRKDSEPFSIQLSEM